MQTSSMGRAIDDLIAIAKASDVITSKTGVYDGPWPTTNTPNEFIAIGLAGLQGDENSGSGTQTLRNLSQPLRVDEDYSIVCMAFVWSGSTSDGSQKRVRDRALALVSIFEVALRSNANLPQDSVLVGGGSVESLELIQLDPEVDKGRLCRIHFNVHVRNVLIT